MGSSSFDVPLASPLASASNKQTKSKASMPWSGERAKACTGAKGAGSVFVGCSASAPCSTYSTSTCSINWQVSNVHAYLNAYLCRRRNRYSVLIHHICSVATPGARSVPELVCRYMLRTRAGKAVQEGIAVYAPYLANFRLASPRLACLTDCRLTDQQP